MAIKRRAGGNRKGWAALALAGAVALAACEREPERERDETEAPTPEAAPAATLDTPEGLTLTPVAFSDLPGWRGDSVAEALPALRRSCAKLAGWPPDRPVGPGGYAGTVADWRPACAALDDLAEGDGAGLREVLDAYFTPVALTTPEGETGLFTGYYEATLKAARTRGGAYQYPLYAPPKDLVTLDLGRFDPALDGKRIVGRVAGDDFVPYHPRAAIAEGALDGRAKVLLWADDPVDVFFLHVQGSGMAELPGGETQRIGYAASNGRPFTAVGRALIRSGEIPREDMSMQAIRDWLRGHPDKARALMQRNARYIFFREIEGAGPVGALGVALTAGRSLAVDPDFVPLGAPLWLATRAPVPDGGAAPFRRLMVAQDTGKAIQGPIRGDVFFGHGEPALARAGRMKHPGRVWLLLPRRVLDRAAPAS